MYDIYRTEYVHTRNLKQITLAISLTQACITVLIENRSDINQQDILTSLPDGRFTRQQITSYSSSEPYIPPFFFMYKQSHVHTLSLSYIQNTHTNIREIKVELREDQSLCLSIPRETFQNPSPFWPWKRPTPMLLTTLFRWECNAGAERDSFFFVRMACYKAWLNQDNVLLGMRWAEICGY